MRDVIILAVFAITASAYAQNLPLAIQQQQMITQQQQQQMFQQGQIDRQQQILDHMAAQQRNAEAAARNRSDLATQERRAQAAGSQGVGTLGPGPAQGASPQP